MKHVFAWIAILFCAGIAAGRAAVPLVLFFFLCLAAFILGALFFKQKIAFGVSLACFVFFLGAGLFRNSRAISASDISKHTFSGDDDIYLVRGFISDEPQTKGKGVSFALNADLLQSEKRKCNCSGKLLVSVKGKSSFSYGEELVLRGRLAPVSARNESYRDYLAGRGIHATMKVEFEGAVVRTGANKGFFLKRFALKLKENIEGVIDAYLPKIPAGILKAMVLGEKAGVPVAIYDSMVRTGTVHILVVSGFNVGIVFFAVLILLKALRLPKYPRLLFAIFCLVVYCLATGASNPVVRATVMAIVFIFAKIVRREPDIYNSLGIAALFILFMNPAQLFDIGFQLSFVSVAAIICVYPKLKDWCRLDLLKIRWLKFIIEGCLVSLSAWLGTAGFIAYYFRMISPVTVLANIFIVPLAALMTLSGFSLVFAATVFSPLAVSIAPTNELLAALLLQINSLMLMIPGAYLYI